MNESKKYRLVTIGDIIDVLTPENIDNFLIDFKSFVESAQNLCVLARVIDPSLKDKKYSAIGEAVFNWIDDGKHEQTGGIRITDPTTGEQVDFPMDIDKMNEMANILKNEKK
jgi:hypothetical protein